MTNSIQGKRVTITSTSNPFASRHIGKQGVVTGSAPLGMICITLDEDGSEYWAETRNVRVAA